MLPSLFPSRFRSLGARELSIAYNRGFLPCRCSGLDFCWKPDKKIKNFNENRMHYIGFCCFQQEYNVVHHILVESYLWVFNKTVMHGIRFSLKVYNFYFYFFLRKKVLVFNRNPMQCIWFSLKVFEFQQKYDAMHHILVKDIWNLTHFHSFSMQLDLHFV